MSYPDYIPTPAQKRFLEEQLTAQQGGNPHSREVFSVRDLARKVQVTPQAIHRLKKKGPDGEYLDHGCRQGTWNAIVDVFPGIEHAGKRDEVDEALGVVLDALPRDHATTVRMIVDNCRNSSHAGELSDKIES